ncbi:type II toxin-antitoxin system RelE/ParE family toxin [Sphingopyxis sp. JAI128]|uniref:type II toxin-antitoxin system RelE/ParE family toxin n=1 Tax=Sphingopyxis sp. JAI128 TaxID=2723066 RepID=UPI00390CD994
MQMIHLKNGYEFSQNPFAGPVVHGTSYGKWRVADSPLLLFYRFKKAAIRIVRVRHHREDWHPSS